MRAIHQISVSLALVAAAVCSSAEQIEDYKPIEPTLSWLSELDEALKVSKETGKPILLEFR